MPLKLATITAKIQTIPNPKNAKLLYEFHKYMIEVGTSDRHQGNELLTMVYFSNYLNPKTTFLDIKRKQVILDFLDSKKKAKDIDPDERWITTWNDYLGTIKHFFRWLHNQRGKQNLISPTEWETPLFVQVKKKRTKRLSPYSETEIWDLDELLSIVKYEPSPRNKAAFTLFWDLDARNHEVTLLRNKNIRLRERYGEGEVPYEAKTGSGPILLTISFPYIRDWMNEHPARSNPEARIICNTRNGAPVRPDAMWRMMKQLRKRIVRLLQKGEISDAKEREKLEYLLKTKKWNPYCLRHSAITHDSDYLPGYALNKKVRWSMTSKQPARYIKRRMGDDLKRTILVHNGIVIEDAGRPRQHIATCPKCTLVNKPENEYCSGCGYPLTVEAFDKIKEQEKKTVEEMIERRTLEMKEQMKAMQQENDNKYSQVMAALASMNQADKDKFAKDMFKRGLVSIDKRED